MSDKITETTAMLTLALGRLIKKYRSGPAQLSVAALSKEMGIGETRIKALESQDASSIGSGGFQVSTLVMFAEVQGKSIETVWQELLFEAGLIKDRQTVLIAELRKWVGFENSDNLESAMYQEDEDFGNAGQWALRMASFLSRLPRKEKAKLELAILENFEDSASTKRIDRLFKISMNRG